MRTTLVLCTADGQVLFEGFSQVQEPTTTDEAETGTRFFPPTHPAWCGESEKPPQREPARLVSGFWGFAELCRSEFAEVAPPDPPNPPALESGIVARQDSSGLVRLWDEDEEDQETHILHRG
jgi:hypothetical protein